MREGHATLVDEVFHSGLAPDAIVLSVGGGGLLSGVVEGLHRNGWKKIPVFAVETTGTASFAKAIKAGRSVELDRITGIATSLGAKRVCQRAVHWAKNHPIHNIVVSDQSALSACERFLDDHRMLVEPACGASLAVVYENKSLLESCSNVLIIVCGGATTTIDQIREWSKKCL